MFLVIKLCTFFVVLYNIYFSFCYCVDILVCTFCCKLRTITKCNLALSKRHGIVVVKTEDSTNRQKEKEHCAILCTEFYFSFWNLFDFGLIKIAVHSGVHRVVYVINVEPSGAMRIVYFEKLLIRCLFSCCCCFCYAVVMVVVLC